MTRKTASVAQLDQFEISSVNREISGKGPPRYDIQADAAPQISPL